MGQLLNTPSGGKSEVLETLHYQGAIATGIALFRIGSLVSHRWGGDENREGSDVTFEADIRTVLGQLQTDGLVVAHDATTGATADLTASPPVTTRVSLTPTGRQSGRHPRPRPAVIRR